MKEAIRPTEHSKSNKKGKDFVSRESGRLDTMERALKQLRRKREIQLSRTEEQSKQKTTEPEILTEMKEIPSEMDLDISTMERQARDLASVITVEKLLRNLWKYLTIEELQIKKKELQSALWENIPSDLAARVTEAQEEADLLIQEKKRSVSLVKIPKPGGLEITNAGGLETDFVPIAKEVEEAEIIDEIDPIDEEALDTAETTPMEESQEWTAEDEQVLEELIVQIEKNNDIINKAISSIREIDAELEKYKV